MAIDTAGNVQSEVIKRIVPYTDLFLYDVKILDSYLSQKYIGAPSDKILENLRLLDSLGTRIIIRHIMVKNVNDSSTEHSALINFLSELKSVESVELLYYHDYGVGKAEELNLKQIVFERPDEDVVNDLACRIADLGIKVIIRK